jgi:hypothetical protein
MPITRMPEIWAKMIEKMPKDRWISLAQIYGIIERNIDLKPDDFLPAAPGVSGDSKWKRNVRNVLQDRKATKEILWEKPAKYKLRSSDDSAATSSSVPIVPISEKKISVKDFEAIQEKRRITGMKGELFVMRYEKSKLMKIGRPDLAEKVEQISKVVVNAGFDIKSFDEHGKPMRIEVKARDDMIPQFEITRNELNMAKKYGRSYWLYMVRNVNRKPILKIYQNPRRLIDSGDISIEPSAYTGRILS